jgi:hypothetical protein|tara:strand:- start:2552 stop:3043 length:492 start_codon:yes stop_codon:yes gene_type:complete
MKIVARPTWNLSLIRMLIDSACEEDLSTQHTGKQEALVTLVRFQFPQATDRNYTDYLPYAAQHMTYSFAFGCSFDTLEEMNRFVPGALLARESTGLQGMYAVLLTNTVTALRVLCMAVLRQGTCRKETVKLFNQLVLLLEDEGFATLFERCKRIEAGDVFYLS